MTLLQRIGYLWRLFGTGLSFSLFGAFGILFTLTLFPLINVVFAFHKPLRQRLSSAVIHYSWRMFLWMMRTLGVLDLHLEGIETLQADKGVIVIANHPSLIDVVILISLMKNARGIVKKGVWDNPVMRSAVRSANYIPNSDDPEELMDKCRETLANGNNIVIFPEGSRSVPGQPMKLQRGFAHLAYRIEAPLRLVEIRCEPPTLLKGQKWYDIPPTRPKFTVRVAERVDLSTLNLDDTPSRAVRQISRHVAARYEELMNHGRA
ncbi:MAG: lysophospholipid acyltransferase family protein [Pikeienuella sp.]